MSPLLLLFNDGVLCTFSPAWGTQLRRTALKSSATVGKPTHPVSIEQVVFHRENWEPHKWTIVELMG
jgi:hypothetical protein